MSNVTVSFLTVILSFTPDIVETTVNVHCSYTTKGIVKRPWLWIALALFLSPDNRIFKGNPLKIDTLFECYAWIIIKRKWFKSYLSNTIITV